MKLSIIDKALGSFLFTGYIPFASGTWGSLAALGIYLIPGFENPNILVILISFFIVIGIPIGSKFEKFYGKDPAQCTIDEAVGTWISLLFIPKNIFFVPLSFVIWRLLDILKPFPARQAEKIKGGWGIMLDDIISGLYTFILMQIILYFVF